MTKKERVLETTLKLIATKGLENTPMSLIASESGVAIGTIYHHFKSKTDILSEMLLEIRKTNMQIFADSINNNDTKRKQFKAMWIGLFERYINKPQVFHFTLHISRTKMIPLEVMEESKKYWKIVFDFFQSGIENEEFINVNPHLLTSLSHTSIITYVELVLTNQLENTPKNLEDAIQFGWRAIRK